MFTVNTNAKGEGTACMVNNGANPSDNQSGRSLQDQLRECKTHGSTERVQNSHKHSDSSGTVKKIRWRSRDQCEHY